jgi:protein-S-isoprenylcysteine O-methyltransferase Ste14
MKLLKGIFAVILVACLIFIFVIALMFEVDTLTLWSAIKLILAYFATGVISFICYISIDIRESKKEDWQELLDRERKGLR